MKIYQCINKVQAAMAKIGIAKDRKNTQQGFNFRGIDDLYNALAPLLAEHGLCILPRVISRTVTEQQSKSGGTLFYVLVEVEYTFVCAEDGSSHVTVFFGEAMDSGDKATNKAMSAAFKYLCLQAFCIPLEGEHDADGTTPVIAPKEVAAPQSAAHLALAKLLIDCKVPDSELKTWLDKAGILEVSKFTEIQAAKLVATLNTRKNLQESDKTNGIREI